MHHIDDAEPENLTARLTVIYTAVDLLRLLAEKAEQEGGCLRAIDVHRLAKDATDDLYLLLGDFAVQHALDSDSVHLNVMTRLAQKRGALGGEPVRH